TDAEQFAHYRTANHWSRGRGRTRRAHSELTDNPLNEAAARQLFFERSLPTSPSICSDPTGPILIPWRRRWRRRGKGGCHGHAARSDAGRPETAWIVEGDAEELPPMRTPAGEILPSVAHGAGRA